MGTFIRLTSVFLGLSFLGYTNFLLATDQDPNHIDLLFVVDNTRPTGDLCQKWINEERTVALNSPSQTKEMHSKMPDNKDWLEENIPYQLSINSDATLPIPLSEPLSLIEEKMGHKEGFSGLLFFTPKESGHYHVISSGRVWIDFIDEEKWTAIPAPATALKSCRTESIYKVVEFPLEKGKQYILYLFRSSDPLVRIMIQRKEQ